jgi:uncharacterized protein (DUF2141 family)
MPISLKHLRLRLVTLPLVLAAAEARAAEVLVRVTNIASANGEVGCALHAGAGTFPTGNKGLPTVWLRAAPGGVTCRFPGVKPGAYAVAVSHDLNGNRVTDMNFLGLPREDWGVSNNVRPSLRAPTFAEAAFEVREGAATTVDVRLGR